MWWHTRRNQISSFGERTSPFKLGGEGSIQSTTGSRSVSISGSNAGYNMFRGSVKGTGYPLPSPVSPSLPLPCVVCHHISTEVYLTTTPSNATFIWCWGLINDWSIGGMTPTAENLRKLRKTWPNVTLSTTYPTWTGLGKTPASAMIGQGRNVRATARPPNVEVYQKSV